MKIGIVTVNYNSTRHTKEFLQSLARCRFPFYIFIADLSDNEPFHIENSYEPLKVCVKRFKNLGYAFGVNQGLKFFLKKGVRSFCVLNNDIFVPENFGKGLEESFQKYDVFTGKIYYAPGYEYYNHYHKHDKGKVFWYAGGIIDWKNAYIFHRGVDEVDRGQYNNVEETDFISGCFFCFSKKVVAEVGFWDEKFFLYYEDADYSVRVRKGGFYLVYNPSLFIWHKNAQSTGGSGSAIHVQHQKKGRLLFSLKHAPLKTKFHVFKNYILGK